MAGYLTVRVIDSAHGRPAAGMTVELYRVEGERRSLVRAVQADAEGRGDAALLPEAEFRAGVYELVFHLGDYFDARFAPPERPRALDEVPVRIGMAGPRPCHVALMVSPHGYATCLER